MSFIEKVPKKQEKRQNHQKSLTTTYLSKISMKFFDAPL